MLRLRTSSPGWLTSFVLAAALAACGPDSTGGGANHLPDGSPATGGDVDSAAPGTDDGGCGLRTCTSAGAGCGLIGDGCGGLVDCGQCTSPEVCGGGGVPNVCGSGMAACVPRTCQSVKANCGPVADGCGGLLQCGSCNAGKSCGGGGTPNVCGAGGPPPPDGGAPSPCMPKTCASQGFTCGPAGDGCGAMLDCGTCAAGQACGVGGRPSQCGPVGMCKPLTCQVQGFNCGMAGDGCGNAIACGACSGNDLCGGGNVPNVCGNTPPPMTCVNLCKQQMQCNGGVTTTVSGTVYAPTNPALGYGNPDPLYNAIVYIPNAQVMPFPTSVSCDQCSAQASGSPLVSATTGSDGKFTLTNAPCGQQIPIVIQLGRWRRQIKVDIACCQNNPLTPEQSRLPRNRTEGDIPLIALVSGSADPIECVLPKIGIDTSEFTLPGGGGRVHFYQANGATLGSGTPTAASLTGNAATLAMYDALIFDCEGSAKTKTNAALQNVLNYTSAGGRVFASHYSYEWLATNGAFSSTAAWNPDQIWPPAFFNNPPFPPDDYAFRALVDQSFPKGVAFAKWLASVGVSGNGQIPVYAVRHDFDRVNNPPAQRWLYDDPNDANADAWSGIPLEYTFNTPVNATPDKQCGRVLFSDFHVNTGGNGIGKFPAECNAAAPMTAQEKVLEFLLFDLTSCVQPDKPPVPMCTPRTCAQQNASCGSVGDGCGNIIMCGPCPAGQVCGGGGKPNQCGATMCTPTTCAAQGIACGPAGDGCGGALQCGVCPAGQSCGGGGKPGVCGASDAGGCVPLTCAAQNLACGPAGDGCGNMISCGTCPAGQSCGGGGKPGQCGGVTCTKTTCAAQKATCGLISDGCNGSIDCGACPAGQTCGGGGVANQCSNIG